MEQLLLSSTPAAVLAVSLLKASLILALAQLVVSAAPRLSAAAKHLLLTAGIAAFLVIPLLALAGPAWRVTIETPPVAVAPVPEPVLIQAEPKADLEIAAVMLAAPVEEATGPSIAATAAMLWLGVTLAVFARLLRSAFRLRSILGDAVTPSARLHALLDDVRGRLGIAIPVRLLRSDRINVPMVWGVRSGTLLLPKIAESWTDEHLRATFIHELGHLQRLDYVSLGLMNVVSALLWFHPQVWVARRHALTEGERACDDLVLRAGERASEYASHLLHVARLMPRREPLAALLAMSRPSQLEGRMYAILSPSINRQAVGGKRLMLSISSFLALIVPLAVVQVAAAPAPPPPPPAAAPRPVAARPAPIAVPAAPAVPAARPVAVKPVKPAPPAMPPLAPVTPLAAVAPIAATPAVPPAAMVPAAPPARPLASVEAVHVVAPLAPIAEVPAVAPPPAAREVISVAPVPPAPAPAAPPPPPAVRIFSPDDLVSVSYTVVGEVRGRACTIKLNRPTNTGDPARNPAEALATRRLLARASAKGANGITKLNCMREIGIGIGCPTAVVCEADAITFDGVSAAVGGAR